MNIDDKRISSAIFYPRKITKPRETSSNVKVLEFLLKDGINIGGFCFIKNQDLPTILLFHGNGEIASDYQYLASKYFDCNVNLAVADFRGYGFSNGDPTYGSLIEDAYPIYLQFEEWMDDNQMRDSLFVKGRSLGSTCASEIGSRNPKRLKGIIFESGFGSLYKMMTGLFAIKDPSLTEESIASYSNDTRIKKFSKPTLIIHGTSDWIVPPEQAKIIYNSLPDSIYKELIYIEGAGHNDISMFENEYYPPLEKFVHKFK
ncbi:MAG: alpha/beta hydrolase [Candidatus Lokiarchaeota archaeon]|nr:alpha/beta hydrolase [Candidatus Lokiarchaeota archaeon]